MNKKRAAPGATSSASSAPSKKRKMDNVQKYYAVKAGATPGVYLTYAECQEQTAGYKGALFKSFTSREDAEAFVAGKKIASDKDGPEKFYAVAVGKPTGIYTDWTDASLAIKGVKGPKYRKFGSRAEAVQYIRENGSQEAVKALGSSSADEALLAKKAKKTDETTAALDASTPATEPLPVPAATEEKDDGFIKIYTDGSSLANGKVGSRAGLGVFFGNGDPRNLSERLVGEPQTNQRAELMAIQRALEIAPEDGPVRIYTDSQYSINCVTTWAPGWARKGWKTASGSEVKNQDIIRAVLARMEARNKAGTTTVYQWVKGHAANFGNVAADRLAVRGANMQA